MDREAVGTAGLGRLRVESEGGTVHLAAMRPTVARVLEITGADVVFTVHETLDQALQE
jgi:anti-anti-sigma regulatory factor